MNKPRRHPGASGVADWIPFKLSLKQTEDLSHLMRCRCADEGSWRAFAEEIERALSLYLSTKRLAEKSSAGSVRRNLRAAASAADTLLARVNALDGNSLQLIRAAEYPTFIKKDVARILVALLNAERFARENFTLGGRRPTEERDTLSALVLHAIRRHTTVTPTATEGKPFESLLKLTLSFVGEPSRDLHELARRALRGAMVVHEKPGLLDIAPGKAR